MEQVKRSRFKLRRIALSIGFILIITIIGTILYRVISNDGEASTTNQVKSVFSGNEMREYNSPENSFTINFPGFPTVEKSSNKTTDKDIPITTYQRVVEDTKEYTLAVYDYTGLTLDEDKALESALNSSLQNTPNAKVLTTKKGGYGEYKAIESSYTISDQGKSFEANIRYIIKGSKMYSLILIGDTKTKFDEFANSLKLT